MRNARALLFLMFAACAPAPARIDQAMDMCARGAPSVEVTASGTVARLLGTTVTRSGTHEAFLLQTGGMNVRIENNTSITGPIPLTRGERVSLQGQYECNDGVIHWTHRDPRGRHMWGYIEAGGKIYR
ncbi:MAG TPA: DUF3465 domain-containing protein [Candidatus Rubrimentiphilum sp.]|nr:DUF3465 domain-containing protein [Candidatus Rubrimentiphilum sp.]